MKVTFIFHSSFAVELETLVLIFDYYGEGKLPYIPQGKQVYFLNSHKHGDHFDRRILKLRDRCPGALYILSWDIHFRSGERREWIYSMKPGEDRTFGALGVCTVRSTDAGVAFFVEAEGKSIYHAGDLNWWHWEGESKAWNNNMAANYKREVDRLPRKNFDAVFVPLDPRLGEAYFWGMEYFLKKVSASHVFPMHCWEEYGICRKVEKEPRMQGLLAGYHALEYAGQEWELC